MRAGQLVRMPNCRLPKLNGKRFQDGQSFQRKKIKNALQGKLELSAVRSIIYLE